MKWENNKDLNNSQLTELDSLYSEENRARNREKAVRAISEKMPTTSPEQTKENGKPGDLCKRHKKSQDKEIKKPDIDHYWDNRNLISGPNFRMDIGDFFSTANVSFTGYTDDALVCKLVKDKFKQYYHHHTLQMEETQKVKVADRDKHA